MEILLKFHLLAVVHIVRLSNKYIRLYVFIYKNIKRKSAFFANLLKNKHKKAKNRRKNGGKTEKKAEIYLEKKYIYKKKCACKMKFFSFFFAWNSVPIECAIKYCLKYFKNAREWMFFFTVTKKKSIKDNNILSISKWAHLKDQLWVMDGASILNYFKIPAFFLNLWIMCNLLQCKNNLHYALNAINFCKYFCNTLISSQRSTCFNH